MSATPTIGGIFAKDIARPIEGVIKADDAEHLAVEVEEYVLTNETAAALATLLETYTAPVYGGGNGVWISGFFGSGKSHLLKMLAHLLGDVPDQSYLRQEVIAQFKTKAEAAGDQMLAASLTRIASIPATALLFNIDVKAPLIDKSQRDALLQVFLKVFNEARGYYAGDPSVARFERDLDRRGLLDPFRQAFAQIAGVPWEQGREEGILQEHNVTQAWSKATGEPTTENILSRYEEQFRFSIEDFADEVADWLDRQQPGHRLLFMADEVGQFIGTDTNLMLNLQSIVEQLNTKCKGRAWVAVTSQEDMEGVIGDRTKAQGQDFSKIQARFVTRMKLTSRDVEEVIQKRLLGKNQPGTAVLADLYDAQQPNFRTLFEFVDGAKTYRNYQSAEHFIGAYPFVPYQFPFFQAALVGLSEHNVFEGRHASVGERSMLGVVQDVTKQLTGHLVGALVPFDLMFAGIRQSVKSASTRNISVAEQQLPAGDDREIAIRLLKALFLVKYVKGFNATPRNLTVLLYDRFDADLDRLGKQVIAALDLLERQTYIQRNGSNYEYLTNEEQEIEQEIKNTDIDSVDVSKLLARIISEDVVKATTVRHQPTGRDFKYELRLDDASYSRAQPIAVHYISPALGQTREVVMAQSMGRDEVRLVLGQDPKLYADLRLYVQTAKYLRLRGGTQLTDTQNHILEAKRRLNAERERDLIGRVKDAIRGSEVIINGAPVPVAASDPESRVQQAVGQLINRLYTRLDLLGGVTYTEPQIAGFLADDPALIDRGTDALQPAADEVYAFITAQRKLGVNVTVKRIVDNFEEKPYGWPLPATQCALARLFATNRITITLDGHLLKRTEIAEALRNNAKHPNLTVSEQRQYDTATVSRIRQFANEFFDTGDMPADPLDLAARIRDKLTEEHRLLTEVRSGRADRYPFVTALDEPIRLLAEVVNHNDDWYLDELPAHTDDLLAAKEDSIDPVRAFLDGPQRSIYDRAAQLVRDNRDNQPYLPAGHIDAVEALLADPVIFRGAGAIKLRDAADALQTAADTVVTSERAQAVAAVNERWSQITGSAAYAEATLEAREQAERAVQAALIALESFSSTVPVIRQRADQFEEAGYTAILNTLEAGRQGQDHTTTPAPVATVVHIKTLPAPAPRVLATAADVDAYLAELRIILNQAIEQGKRVTL